MDDLSAYEQSGSTWTPKIYTATGQWSLRVVDGQLVFELGDDFRTSPGPDVKVYAAPKKMSQIGEREPIDRESVQLGQMFQFSGAQSYALPAGTIQNTESILLHCQAYSVVWTGVDLA